MGSIRFGLLVVATLAIAALVNRLGWRSGATDREALGPQPGDEVIAHPMAEWTRATTIQAPPSQIWPWLVQMGYDRGGWYTNADIDRMVWGVSAPSANKLLPQFQQLTVGDIIADGPHHAAYFHVRALEPERAIVYHSVRHPFRGHPLPDTTPETLRRMEETLISGGTYLEFSWAFVLEAVGPASTRVIIRTRANYAPAAIGLLQVPLGWVDLFHAHTMLRGVRARVETSD